MILYIDLLRHVEFVEFSSLQRNVDHEAFGIENVRHNGFIVLGRNPTAAFAGADHSLSLIHISEPTRPILVSRMPSSA